MDHVVVWAQKGRNYLRHTRQRTCIECEPFGISLIFKEKEIFTRQSDRDKPIYLCMAHVLNFRPNIMRPGYDPKTIHIKFVVEKLVLREVLICEIRILL